MRTEPEGATIAIRPDFSAAPSYVRIVSASCDSFDFLLIRADFAVGIDFVVVVVVFVVAVVPRSVFGGTVRSVSGGGFFSSLTLQRIDV